jgi:hypothetical protein
MSKVSIELPLLQSKGLDGVDVKFFNLESSLYATVVAMIGGNLEHGF